MSELLTIEPEDLATTGGGKLICPACGHSGWGAGWWLLHRTKLHHRCRCGRSFVSLKAHLNKGCPT